MRRPLLCYFLPKNIISNLFELFFQQKILPSPLPPCATPQANAHDLSNCHLNKMRHSLSSVIFYPQILFQIYLNYFFQQKTHIPTTEFHTLTQNHIDAITTIGLHKKHPTGATLDCAQQEQHGFTCSGAGNSAQLICKWRAGIPDAKWLFGAFPFAHQCAP